MDISFLPSVNAGLNTASAIFITFGYFFARKKKLPQHKIAMAGACFTSTLFLISYLYYHYHHGATKFQGQGWIRPVYFSILLTHTILAAVIVPMVLMTLYRAFRGQFEKHVLIARVTVPVWLYVSITGVLIYWMLYHLGR